MLTDVDCKLTTAPGPRATWALPFKRASVSGIAEAATTSAGCLRAASAIEGARPGRWDIRFRDLAGSQAAIVAEVGIAATAAGMAQPGSTAKVGDLAAPRMPWTRVLAGSQAAITAEALAAPAVAIKRPS